MSIEVWLMFAAAYLVVTLSPGPNVILVLKNSVLQGWKSAFITILGNLSCQLVIVCLVAIGVGGLLSQLPQWFLGMKIIGGCYLIYLGIKSLCQRTQHKLSTEPDETMTVRSARSLFIQAFFVSASNPKTLIFLSAFLPQFLDIQHSYIEQFSVMYLTIGLIVSIVHLSYAWLIGQLGHKLHRGFFERRLAKMTGGLFITMGTTVLLSSRP
ncbi:LysE family translocator [Celerinatantimonas sp. YJH-8]|uniref:LysE family translocator n=1 Tax=Celerinatantimonas sp. YJH-8 TaxID=3228714 RepID=UPI0038C1C114